MKCPDLHACDYVAALLCLFHLFYISYFTIHILHFTFAFAFADVHACDNVATLICLRNLFIFHIFLTASIFIERQRLEIGLEIFYFRFHILLFTFYILTFISYICICRAACMGQCCYSHLPMQSSPHLSFLLTSLTIPLTTG